MRIITKVLDIEEDYLQVIESLLEKEAPLSDTLFLDIETTGLSPAQSRIYLIGCLYYESDAWHMIQWFDNTGTDEKLLLSSFLLFADRYHVLVHYNGSRFDLPFLTARMEALGLEGSLSSMNSMDLYKILQPYRNILGLPDYKQQTVEEYFGTGRTEEESGRDLIKVYQQYIGNPCKELLAPLTEHNEADLEGLLSLVPVFIYRHLPSIALTVRRAQADYYNDVNGKRKEEMILYFDTDLIVPAPLHANTDGCHLKIEGSSGVLKIPIYNEEMKYFYAGYKDYFYLPDEDTAIHKYIASYVDKDNKVPARPDNCYTRKTAFYLPQWQTGGGDLFRKPFFKRSYKDPDLFFEFTDDLKKDRNFLSDYAYHVYRHLLGI